MPVHDWTRVDAGLFHSFRFRWVCALCDALNSDRLQPEYFALSARSIPKRTGEPSSEAAGYARIADRVSVHDRQGQVVAIIEVVSPGNKAAVAELRAFVEKVSDLIQQGVHALVVDIFPPTVRDPSGIHKAIWDQFEDQEYTPPADQPLTLASYDAGPIKTAYVEPIGVGDALPEMPLFLEPERYVPVPLEETYRVAWDAFPTPLKGLLTPVTLA